MSAPTPYHRVSPQTGGILAASGLWLADDHVLQIRSTAVQEHYERIYFRDLKAVLVTDSSKRDLLFFGGVCGVLFFGFLAFIATLTETRAGPGIYFLWFVTLISLATSILAYLRGRRRKVYAVTALQTIYWRTLIRQPQIDAFLARLRPLVEAAQATLPKPEPPQPQQQPPQQQEPPQQQQQPQPPQPSQPQPPPQPQPTTPESAPAQPA